MPGPAAIFHVPPSLRTTVVDSRLPARTLDEKQKNPFLATRAKPWLSTADFQTAS